MRRTRSLGLLISVSLTLLPGDPAVSSTDPSLPEVAGHTTISGQGVTGITVYLPAPVRIFARDMHISAEDARYAFVGITSQYGSNGFCDFCFLQYAEYLPEARFNRDTEGSRFYGGCSNDAGDEVGCPFIEGPVEIYFMSDGVATLTLDLPELEGETVLQATASVDGRLEHLEMRCGQPFSCENEVFGGKAYEIGLDGKPAHAGVRIWLYNDPGPEPTYNPNNAGFVPCAYPGFSYGTVSPDPEKHPHGCDVLPSENNLDEYGGFETINYHVIGPLHTWANGSGYIWGDGAFKTHGLQYLGFRMRRFNTFQGGRWGAVGKWLTQGMACASGDFQDCHA